MKETSSLKGTKLTATEISQVNLVSNVQYPLKKNDNFYPFVAAI